MRILTRVLDWHLLRRFGGTPTRRACVEAAYQRCLQYELFSKFSSQCHVLPGENSSAFMMTKMVSASVMLTTIWNKQVVITRLIYVLLSDLSYFIIDIYVHQPGVWQILSLIRVPVAFFYRQTCICFRGSWEAHNMLQIVSLTNTSFYASIG